MRRLLASSLIMGGIEDTSLSAQECKLLQSFPLHGVTLFKRNISDANQVHALNTQLNQIIPYLEIAVDQEGGRVSRLRDFSMPDGSLFPDKGAAGKIALSEAEWEENGLAVGTALEKLGFTTNFAPVVDVLTNVKNECIGDRAFSNHPEGVVKKAGAFLTGQNKTKIKGVLKHFPGQGHADIDTHLGAATVNLSEAELFESHVKAFEQLSSISHGVMTAHSSYPQVDSLPASISSKWITQILREKVGFDGLVYSDDFLMHAIPQDAPSWNEAVVEGVFAGLDVVLVCRHLDRSRQAIEAIEKKMKASKAFETIVESRARSKQP